MPTPTTIPAVFHNPYKYFSGSPIPLEARLAFGGKLRMTKSKGFSLVELLVIVSLITILSVTGMVMFQGARGKAQEAKMKADINSIKKAYESNFDPTLNNGQGGYKSLQAGNFSDGKIPSPDGSTNTSYIVYGPETLSLKNTNSKFKACVSSTTGLRCLLESIDCYCVNSSSGQSFDQSVNNLVLNPDIETTAYFAPYNYPNGWYASYVGSACGVAINRVTTDKHSGNYSGEISITSLTCSPSTVYGHPHVNSISVLPNTTYFFSVYVKVLQTISSMTLIAAYADNSNNNVGTPVIVNFSQTPAQGWVRQAIVITTPTNATRLAVSIRATNPTATGAILLWDDVIVE